MNHSFFVALIYNAALLLALGLILDSVTLRTYRLAWWSKILSGLCLGLIALAIMINPWVLKPGVVFDTRSILFCLTGMFFGAVPTFIAASIAATFRIIQGGAGVYMGVAVIIESVGWGYIWKRLHHKWRHPYTSLEFYLLGLVTHITMMSLTILLPSSIRMHVFSTIFLPVIIIYPLVTVALGQILMRRIRIRQERHDLELSEMQFRSLYDNAPMPYQSLDNQGKFVTVNVAWTKALGYSLAEIQGKYFSDIISPECLIQFNDCFAKFKKNGYMDDVELYLIKKDSTKILVSFNGNVVTDENGNFKQTQCILTDITDKKRAEQVLAQSEEKYRLLSETAQDMIIVHHFDGSMSYANNKAVDFLGINKADLASVNVWDFIPTEYQVMLEQHALERRQGFLGSRLYQIEIYDKNKRKVPVEVSSTPIVAESKIVGIIAVIRDISERLADQLRLKENQQRFEMFMNNLPGGAFIKDSNSKVLFVNKYLSEVQSADRFVGKKPHELLPKEIADKIIAEDKETLQLGIHNEPEEMVHFDGSKHIYDTTKFVLPNPNGEPMIGGIALDITDKALTEEQRNRYAHRLELLRKIDSIVLDTLSFDTVCSAAVQNLQKLIPFALLAINVMEGNQINVYSLLKPEGKYGYLQNNLKYTPNREFIDELIRNKAVVINDVTTYPKPKDMPIRSALMADGMQSFMYNAMALKDDLVGFLWFASEQKNFFNEEYQEIATEFANQLAIVLQHLQLINKIQEHAKVLEQKVKERTKQLTQSNQELEAFSYSVAHDLRSPLRTINGYCSILLDDYSGDLHAKALTLLSTIRVTSQRMDTLIKELLELAKISRNPIKYSTVNMYAKASSICKEIVDAQAPEQFEVTIEELPPCLADSSLLILVWQNLLENAVKFTLPCPQKLIHIGFKKRETETVYYVKDSGVGFDMEFVNKIFDPFQRLHREQEFEGTGIGLAIVKKIIDRHLGELWAESIIGSGTTIYFSIPDNPNQ